MKFLPILLLLSGAALAEPPPGTDPNSSVAKWFESLHDELGQSCCGLGDCRAVTAEQRDGHWYVRMVDTFLKVPDRIVTYRDDNPTGHSILCASPVQPSIMYCFIPETGA